MLLNKYVLISLQKFSHCKTGKSLQRPLDLASVSRQDDNKIIPKILLPFLHKNLQWENFHNVLSINCQC